jgi:hypothetical protein
MTDQDKSSTGSLPIDDEIERDTVAVAEIACGILEEQAPGMRQRLVGREADSTIPMNLLDNGLTYGWRLLILEDGPWLIVVSGPHADEGGEILEGMYAQGCTSIEDSRIRARSGRAGGLDIGSGVESTCSALAMSTQRQCLPT